MSGRCHVRAQIALESAATAPPNRLRTAENSIAEPLPKHRRNTARTRCSAREQHATGGVSFR